MASFDPTSEEDGPIASINIVPFVDIVLVLLVIFMLTSARIVRATFGVELPTALAESAQVEPTLNLVYTREGELILDGDPMPSLEEARGRIQALAAARPGARAAIAADRGASYGKIIELIDLVKGCGIHSFALDVERSPDAPSSAPRPTP